MKGKIFFFLAVLYLCTAGCYKYERTGGNVDKPGIALTFDDFSIDNWCKYLPLLDSFGAKATFYISSYHLLTPHQKDKLREIQRHGHEIGYHTTFHNNLSEYVKQHGIKDLLEIEIYQDLKKMNRDGFYPTTFAYPYGVHDNYLDAQLLTIFKSLRALNGSKDLGKSVTRTTSNTLLYGLGMDNDKRSNGTLEKMMDLANQNHNCLVLVGHQIENPASKFQVPYQKLKCVLQKARNLNMEFYRISEISN
jgi:peptidoglycan/xylan/chitin deacetylase (PgdA/CDA1 family)